MAPATHYAPVLSAEYADLLTREGHQELIDREPVGSGPFLLNEYRPGQYIRPRATPPTGKGCRACRRW